MEFYGGNFINEASKLIVKDILDKTLEKYPPEQHQSIRESFDKVLDNSHFGSETIAGLKEVDNSTPPNDMEIYGELDDEVPIKELEEESYDTADTSQEPEEEPSSDVPSNQMEGASAEPTIPEGQSIPQTEEPTGQAEPEIRKTRKQLAEEKKRAVAAKKKAKRILRDMFNSQTTEAENKAYRDKAKADQEGRKKYTRTTGNPPPNKINDLLVKMRAYKDPVHTTERTPFDRSKFKVEESNIAPETWFQKLRGKEGLVKDFMSKVGNTLSSPNATESWNRLLNASPEEFERGIRATTTEKALNMLLKDKGSSPLNLKDWLTTTPEGSKWVSRLRGLKIIKEDQQASLILEELNKIDSMPRLIDLLKEAIGEEGRVLRPGIPVKKNVEYLKHYEKVDPEHHPLLFMLDTFFDKKDARTALKILKTNNQSHIAELYTYVTLFMTTDPKIMLPRSPFSMAITVGAIVKMLNETSNELAYGTRLQKSYAPTIESYYNDESISMHIDEILPEDAETTLEYLAPALVQFTSKLSQVATNEVTIPMIMDTMEHYLEFIDSAYKVESSRYVGGMENYIENAVNTYVEEYEVPKKQSTVRN